MGKREPHWIECFQDRLQKALDQSGFDQSRVDRWGDWEADSRLNPDRLTGLETLRTYLLRDLGYGPLEGRLAIRSRRAPGWGWFLCHPVSQAPLWWLAGTPAGHDSEVITPEDWSARGETLGLGSLGVLVFDGSPLYGITNGYYPDTGKVLEQFDQILDHLGLFREQVHSWSLALYRVPEAVGVSVARGAPGTTVPRLC